MERSKSLMAGENTEISNRGFTPRKKLDWKNHRYNSLSTFRAQQGSTY